MGCRVVSLYGEFERGCLDGTLGDSEEVAGFFEEVALVKRLTLCEDGIGYPQSGFRNNLSFSRVVTACFFHLNFLR